MNLLKNDGLISAQVYISPTIELQEHSIGKTITLQSRAEDEDEKQADNSRNLKSELSSAEVSSPVKSEKKNKLKKKCCTSEVNSILMKIIDVIGIVGLYIYCLYINSYISIVYMLMLLLIVNFQWQKIPKGIGMYLRGTDQTMVVPLDRFIDQQHNLQDLDQQVIDINIIEQNVSNKNIYRPKYWIIFTDISRVFWIILLVVSVIFFIFKIVIYSLLKVNPENIYDLMSQNNWDGLEIYFTINNTDPLDILITLSQYTFSFMPNIIVIILSAIALIINRVESITPLELYNYRINSKSFRFYLVMVWFFLVALVVTSQSVQGYILFMFQLALTFKIFYNEPSPNIIEKVIIKTLMIYMYLMLIICFGFGTNSGTQFLEQKLQNLGDFLGLFLVKNLEKYNWSSIIFVICSYCMFVFICLLNEQMNHYDRRVKLAQAIKICEEGWERFKLEQESIINKHQGSIQHQINAKVNKFTEKIKKYMDTPTFTIRFLQISSIIIIVLQQTYYSLALIIWSFITGYWFNIQVCYYTSIVLAIPAIFLNFIPFFYANIYNNEYIICGDYSWQQCQNLGFIIQDHPEFQLVIMSVSISLFILLIKQIQEFQVEEENKQKRKQEGLTFLARKDKQLKDVPITKLLAALILKLSYWFSLFILFWVSFVDISLSQFILVLFLLVFLINDSVQVEWKILMKSNQVDQKQVIILVPFALKYWKFLVIYIDILVLLSYVYQLFLPDNFSLTFQIIGFTQGTEISPYYWILFYFVQLQYGAYNSRTYKYSNRIFECLMARENFKKMFPSYKKHEGVMNLIYLKSIIWISFFVNLLFLILEPFSLINSILLIIVGLIFCYYANSQLIGVNYRFMKNLWYVYLNLLVVILLIRYIMQFLCIPKSTQITNQWLLWLYQQLQQSFQEIGFYYFEKYNLKWRYLPDLFIIFLGAMSLKTFQTFSSVVEANKLDQLRNSFNADGNSKISDSSQDGQDHPEKLYLSQKAEESKQLARMMEISLMSEFSFMKQPVVLFANVNTDMITIYVVFVAVFIQISIATGLLMLLYLYYFFKVHKKILDELQNRHLIQELDNKIMQIQSRYKLMEDSEIQISQFIDDINQSKRMVSSMKLMRMKTRIKVKLGLWSRSFFFTAFCVLLTYLSQVMTSQILVDYQNNIWVKQTIYLLYIFGTYAVEVLPNSPYSCFCGEQDINENKSCNQTNQEITSNIMSKIWFFLVLILVNVVDSVATEILQDDLLSQEDQLNRLEKEVFEPIIHRTVSLGLNLNQIKEETEEEEEEEKQFQGSEPQSVEIVMLAPIKIDYKYIQLESEPIVHEIIIARKYALIINYYRSQDMLLSLTFNQAFFKVMQRFFVLIFLMNSLLMNNIFSFFYLGVSTYLFLKTTSLQSIRLLNTCCVVIMGVHYLFLMLNFQTDTTQILSKNNHNFTGWIGLDNYVNSYLGFEGGDLQDCQILSTSIFKDYSCKNNENFKYTFILNTIVLSMIYLYFIMVEFVANIMIEKTIKIEKQIQLVEQVVIYQLKNNRNAKITINYKAWKNKIYSFSNNMNQIVMRYGHLIIIFILLYMIHLSISIFQTIEMCAIFIIFPIFEFYFKWPYQRTCKELIIKSFKWLFFIPVFTIFCESAFSMPIILSQCAQITKETNGFIIFGCQQIYDIHIIGMVISMFVISLFFDLSQSQSYEQNLLLQSKLATLNMRIFQKCLAYSINEGKFEELIYAEKCKHMLKKIQVQIMLNLKRWHAILNQKENQSPEKQEVKHDEELNDPDNLNSKYKQILSTPQQIIIKCIEFLQIKKDNHKFMDLINLLEYILSQNSALNQHVYIPVEAYLKKETKYFKNAVDMIDLFQIQIIRILQEKKDVTREDVDKLIQEYIVESQQHQFNKYLEIHNKEQQQQILIDSKKQQSKELDYIHIYDPRLLIINTKQSNAHKNLAEQSTLQMVLTGISQLGKFLLSNWDTLIYITIIFYFFKNSGLLGGVLPALLFLWVIIDEAHPPKIFWIIYYAQYSLTIVFIYLKELVIQYRLITEQDQDLWWYPIYDCDDNGILYEIFMINLLIVQVVLQKRWGVYLKTLDQIESIYQAYLRVKINSFYKLEKVLSIEVQEGNSQDPNVNQQHEIDQLSENQLFSKFQEGINKKPELLQNGRGFNFFERTFSQWLFKPGKDLYSVIFIIQIIIFIFLLFFYSDMTLDGYGLNNTVKYNTMIPAGLVLSLLVQVFIMVIERYICLRNSQLEHQQKLLKKKKSSQIDTFSNKLQETKSLYKFQFIMKYALQIIVLVFIYWFIFFYLGKPWQPNQINTSTASDAQMKTVPYVRQGAISCFFVLYASYFYISALQLKYGYREVKMRNTFFENYNMVSYSYGKALWNIPFLFELKVLMDWTFLPSSLDVWQWFKLENIHGLLFFAKVQSDGYRMRPLGERIVKVQKFGLGCTLVLGILMCIFGPLLLFSTLNPITELNLVDGASIQISILNQQSGLQIPIYSSDQPYGLSNTLSSEIKEYIWNAHQQNITSQFLVDAPSLGALQQFQMPSYGNFNWDITNPLFIQLTQQLNESIHNPNSNAWFLNVTYLFLRGGKRSIIQSFPYPQNELILEYFGDQPNYYVGQNFTSLDLNFLQNINDSMSSCSGKPVLLPNFYIETLQIYSSDGISFKPKPILSGGPPPQNISAQLVCLNSSNFSQYYWNFVYNGTSTMKQSQNQTGKIILFCIYFKGLIFFLSSTPESSLTTGYSLITFYTAIILLIGSFVKSFFSGEVWLIQFTEMAKPDDLLMICQAVSIARGQKDFVQQIILFYYTQRENLLYYELIDIIRSPEFIKIMSGSWVEIQKRKELDQKVQEERKKLKED